MVATEVESRVAAHSSLVFRCSSPPILVARAQVIADYLDVEAVPRCRNNARSMMSILISSKGAKKRGIGIGDVLSAGFHCLHVRGRSSAPLSWCSNAVSVSPFAACMSEGVVQQRCVSVTATLPSKRRKKMTSGAGTSKITGSNVGAYFRPRGCGFHHSQQ